MSRYPYPRGLIHNPLAGSAPQRTFGYYTVPVLVEPVPRFQWEATGLQAKPTILYGLAPLGEGPKELQHNARTSIAWVQPTPTAGNTWDLGMPAECASLCWTIERDRLFQQVRLAKLPGVYQLEPGGTIWVETGFLGVCILVQERDAKIQLVSFKKQSTCDMTWSVGNTLYLTSAGIQSEQRVKLVLLLFKVEPSQL